MDERATAEEAAERFGMKETNKLPGYMNVRDNATGEFTKEDRRFTDPDNVTVETDKEWEDGMAAINSHVKAARTCPDHDIAEFEIDAIKILMGAFEAIRMKEAVLDSGIITIVEDKPKEPIVHHRAIYDQMEMILMDWIESRLPDCKRVEGVTIGCMRHGPSPKKTIRRANGKWINLPCIMCNPERWAEVINLVNAGRWDEIENS